ncbi:prosaposin [Vespula pensylvanica]|uniref:Prosaposin n=1 Tax=Vespula pensylvanica TaxID=30213 RepID=A0A834NZI1_VESPE|nr:prosaposin [Vespula pensylvanica]KAF7422035.1 hypothetical protein H0235_009871 [Vespula pensylvanica]
MKETLIALCAILAVSTAKTIITAESTPYLLGAEECAWGPSYWCHNITTSAHCHATHHCIKKVWENIEVPEDNDTVCGVCKDMVQQARDQLESNQTQQDLKAVFEGSCKLIHINPIVEECIKLVDQFIPELVETLASQMNPSVVCSVAGLCNSAHIDMLLNNFQEQTSENKKIKSISLEKDELEPDECSKCFTIATHMEYNLKDMSKDTMLQQMLVICGDFSSFSDACSSIILTYFDTIYSHLQDNFNAQNICHLSGQCSDKFHKHEDGTVKPMNVEIRPLSSVGMVEVDDDLPCKLCEQLVGHLKDLLVANTTEAEFHLVLQGLCKQTKSFATECKAIVDEYYPEIYTYLTTKLNGNVVCQMSGICPSPGKRITGPIAPLIPTKVAEIGVRILNKKIDTKNNNTEVEEMQLPIERYGISFNGPKISQTGAESKEGCALCEYVLHYIQIAITDPTNEEKVKQIIGKICKKLPNSIENECGQFVDTYGDAVVALLAQEIDPSQVCPMIHVCPSEELIEVWNKAPKGYIIETHDKPSCPLCLLALTQIYDAIKDNKTEVKIKDELDKLCSHLPNTLIDQCADFVKEYSKELIEMLLADLTPKEICVYIKLCNPEEDPGPRNFFLTNKDGEIMTNEIPDFLPLQPNIQNKLNDSSSCVMCEFVMQYVDKAMSKKKTRDEIEHIVYGICNHLPKTISKECNKFVSQYADAVIQILSEDVTPKEVCTMIGFCTIDTRRIRESMEECALCQLVISTIDKLLDNPNVDSDIEEVVSKICKYMPANKQNKCVMMMEIYEQSIINIIKSHGDVKKICSKIALCSENDYLAMTLTPARIRQSYLVNKQCIWGQSYWCLNYENAVKCKAVEHCMEKVWKKDSTFELKQSMIQMSPGN